MKIIYDVYNLTPTKIALFKADLEYLKCDINNQLSEKLLKIRKDKNAVYKLINEFRRKVPGLNITIDSLISNIEAMEGLDMISYTIEPIDATSIHVELSLGKFIDTMNHMGLPLPGIFDRRKKIVNKLQKSVKENYSTNFTMKLIEDEKDV